MEHSVKSSQRRKLVVFFAMLRRRCNSHGTYLKPITDALSTLQPKEVDPLPGIMANSSRNRLCRHRFEADRLRAGFPIFRTKQETLDLDK